MAFTLSSGGLKNWQKYCHQQRTGITWVSQHIVLPTKYCVIVVRLVSSCIAVCNSKNLTKPRAREVNPPDLWIHGTAADVGDKISDDEQHSTVRSSSLAARSDRMGSSTCVTVDCVTLHMPNANRL